MSGLDDRLKKIQESQEHIKVFWHDLTDQQKEHLLKVFEDESDSFSQIMIGLIVIIFLVSQTGG